MGIVEERAVAVDARIDSLVENVSDAARVERGGKLSTVRILNAMYRPQDLLDAVEDDAIARLFARMFCGKAAVVWRMPVLRGKDKVEASLQSIGERDDFITARDR